MCCTASHHVFSAVHIHVSMAPQRQSSRARSTVYGGGGREGTGLSGVEVGGSFRSGQVQVTAWAAWTHARALDGAQYTTVLLLLLPYHAMPGVSVRQASRMPPPTKGGRDPSHHRSV
jgi:hypothetical protein